MYDTRTPPIWRNFVTNEASLGEHIYMGSEGDWGNNLRSDVQNLRIMTASTFYAKYGVEQSLVKVRDGKLVVPVTTMRWKGGPWKGSNTIIKKGSFHQDTKLVTLEEAKSMGLIDDQNGGPNLNAEAFIDGLLQMGIGEKITGHQLTKTFEANGVETPVKVSRIIKNVTRVDQGLQINLTFLARTVLAVLPKSPEVEKGAIVTITREDWPDNKNSVLHLTSPDIKIYYDHKLVPLNIYINNNGFTMDRVPYPSYYTIMKGTWH